MDEPDILEYYSRRVDEYEAVYRKPERQPHLASLEERVAETMAGHDVLEVACGTGYWTAVMATTADSVLATDASDEVLATARSKSYPLDDLAFVQADAYSLAAVDGAFSAGFAGFWWSHVPAGDLDTFLETFHAKLDDGARVCFVDNRFVEGSNTPISGEDEAGNTYQMRTLSDGSEHTVLKNFPTEAELRDAVAPYAGEVEYRDLEYYWLLSYVLE